MIYKLLLLASLAFSYPVYKDARILFIGPKAPQKPGNWCRELVSYNPSLGSPTCIIDRSLSRNEATNTYFQWLDKNAEFDQELSLLHARDPEVQQTLEERKDDYLLFFASNKMVFLFFGGKRYPLQKSNLTPFQAAHLHGAFFEEQAVRALTKKEKEAARTAPDAYYSEELALDHYFRVGYGYMTGFGGNRSAKFKAFSQNTQADSVSTWSWITQESPIYHIETGLGYNRFAQLGLYLDYSSFSAKYDKQDPLHSQLKKWDFERYEVGINLRLGHTFFLPVGEVMPYGQISIHQTFYNETFEDNSLNPEKEKRLELQSETLGRPSGGSLLAGAQYLWDNTWGIAVEGGVASRSLPQPDHRSQQTNENLTNGTSSPQLIATNAKEWTGKISLIYNIRRWK